MWRVLSPHGMGAQIGGIDPTGEHLRGLDVGNIVQQDAELVTAAARGGVRQPVALRRRPDGSQGVIAAS